MMKMTSGCDRCSARTKFAVFDVETADAVRAALAAVQ
jgi:hypothetical protein